MMLKLALANRWVGVTRCERVRGHRHSLRGQIFQACHRSGGLCTYSICHPHGRNEAEVLQEFTGQVRCRRGLTVSRVVLLRLVLPAITRYRAMSDVPVVSSWYRSHRYNGLSAKEERGSVSCFSMDGASVNRKTANLLRARFHWCCAHRLQVEVAPLSSLV